MKYKLICIDMDGTLLNEQGKLSDRNRQAIIDAKEKGVIVAITTGRVYKFVNGFTRRMGIEGPMITSNGASVALSNNEPPFYNATLCYEQLVPIYEAVKKHKVRTHFTTPEGILFDQPLPEGHIYHEINEDVEEQDRMELKLVEDCLQAFKTYDGKIIKALCLDEETREHLDKVREELEAIGGYEVVSSWINNIEVMPPGVNKGNGVKMLAEKLNIPLDQVICMGDSENDLSMLQVAGLAVAMGNATEQIKNVADYVTATNEENGVALAIEKFVLGIDN